MPETEYSKFQNMIRQYEKILHPDIFRPLMTQLHLCYEESKRDAYAKAKISDDALWIEREILKLKESMERDDAVNTFHIKWFYKQVLKKLIGISRK